MYLSLRTCLLLGYIPTITVTGIAQYLCQLSSCVMISLPSACLLVDPRPRWGRDARDHHPGAYPCNHHPANIRRFSLDSFPRLKSIKHTQFTNKHFLLIHHLILTNTDSSNGFLDSICTIFFL